MTPEAKNDPVCGVSVDPLRARAVAIVAGERFYFCSAVHRDLFAADPGHFVAALRAGIETEVVVEALAAAAESPLPAPPPPNVARFEIGGMTGADDVERVRRAIARVAGVEAVEIDLVTEVAAVTVDPASFAPRALVEAVATAGFEAAPRRRRPDEDLGASAALGRRAVVAACAAAVLAAAALPASGTARIVVGAVAGATALALARGLVSRLRRATELLAAAAIALLVVGGVAFAPLLGAGAVAVVAYALAARWLEGRARGAAAAALAALAPLPVSGLRAGDLVRLAPGDVVPVDGVVRSGDGTLDESASGGTTQAERAAGDPVVAGTRVTGGGLVVEARRTGADRALARLRVAVAELHASPAPLPRVAALAARAFAPAALVGAALAAAIHLGGGPAAALGAAAAMLVALCPLAPALVTPVALTLAGARAARRGVLYRNAEAIERAAAVNVVAVDKGATLTQGRRLVEAAAATAGDERRVVALAAAAEQGSDSPLARALRSYAQGQGIHVPPAEQTGYVAGRGVRATIAGAQVAVGSRRMAEADGADGAALDALAAGLGGRRVSGIYVLVDGKLEGVIGVGEPARAGARDFVAALHERGVRVAMLTGDEAAAAESLGGDLAIDEVHAALAPDAKKRLIADLRARHGAVAVVGDSVDDAAALAAGDVGIALARGVGLELAAAGVTVLRGDLDGVLAALDLARGTTRRMRLALGLALAHAAAASLVFAVLGLGAAAPLAACASTTLVIAAIVALALLR